MIKKIYYYKKYIQIFSSFADIVQFRRLKRRQLFGTDPVPLRIRKLGGAPLLCRPGTTDSAVFFDALIEGYHLPPHPLAADCTILDLGANVGYTMADFASRYPTARIIGVELDSTNADLALRNVASFGSRCQVLQAAVWHEDGQVTYGGKQEWVLDRFQLDHIDYPKMDIEGAEASVLRSDARWLQCVGCLKVEIHAPATMEWCSELLSEAGFTCSPDNHHPHYIVAVRKRSIA